MARLRQCKMTEGCFCISQPRQSIIGAENQCHTQLECEFYNRANKMSEKAYFPRNSRKKHIFLYTHILLIWRGYVNVRWLKAVSVSHNRAKALLTRKINVTTSFSVIIATAPLEYEKMAKVRQNASQNTYFFSVTTPKHDVCFLARYREPSCVELFLIYLSIFLRSLRIKNRRFWTLFISVDLIKKLTKKSQFLPHFQKFRKSVDF